MKIVITAQGASTQGSMEQFNIGAWRIQVDAPAAVSFWCGEARVILSGEFYYAHQQDRVDFLRRRGAPHELQRLMALHGPEHFPTAVEGMYCGLWVNERTGRAVIFNDPLNRRHVFYTERHGTHIFADQLRAVVEAAPTREINQLGLYSFCLLGYTPLNETLYQQVKRLGADTCVVITPQTLRHEIRTCVKPITAYTRDDLSRYESILTAAVESRASASDNIVMHSGGWDSTALLYLLTRHLGPAKVRSIVFDVRLADKRSFNIFEVDKVQRIAQYFGVKTDACVIDYGDKASLDAWEKSLAVLRDNHVYFWLHHTKLAGHIGATASPDASIFSGEASDSIHNFGYSQFVSVNYPNMYLREYADKMKSYLYGPTFLQAIDAGHFLDDQAYQFFRHYYGEARFEDVTHFSPTQRRQKYLEAFVFSYPRVPFARWHNEDIAQPALMQYFTRHIEAAYFQHTANSLSPENLYFYLLQLYRLFHFQSAQMTVSQAALSPFGLSCQMPFLDIRMLEYMYAMPESWGRGLELRTTKYPLRYLATERWHMPIHILEEPGPHSYIAENDRRWTYSGGNWDIYCEILYNSVFSEYFRTSLAALQLEDYFDGALFNVPYMQQVIARYVAGQQDIPSHNLLFRLGLLCSIGLYR